MTDLNKLVQPIRTLDGNAATSTVAIATTAASQQITLAVNTNNVASPITEYQVDVLNSGATPLAVAVCFGTNPVAVFPTTTPGAYVLAAGERRTFTVPSGTTKAAVISTGTTGTVYFTTGHGKA